MDHESTTGIPRILAGLLLTLVCLSGCARQAGFAPINWAYGEDEALLQLVQERYDVFAQTLERERPGAELTERPVAVEVARLQPLIRIRYPNRAPQVVEMDPFTERYQLRFEWHWRGHLVGPGAEESARLLAGTERLVTGPEDF